MASSQDGNLGIWSGYTPGDNGWTSQHNQNWDTLDAFCQATVLSITTSAPPGSPANGAAYIVPAGASGAWASNTNKVAVWTSRGSGQWTLYTPKAGWLVYNQADGGEYLYNGSSWVLYYSQKLAVPQDYISGLKMVWNSATSISVTSGAAYVPSLGRLVLPGSTLTLSGLSLTASTWYHLYLYENAGTPTLECVTTAPAAPYFGTARAKTGDTTRRYIGSVLTDASGNLWYFQQSGNNVSWGWGGTGSGPQRPLASGTATTAASLSLSGSVPVTASSAVIRAVNSDASQGVRIANSTVPGASGASGAGTTNFLYAVAANSNATIPTALDGNQAILYWFVASPSGSLAIDVFGYVYER